MTSPWASGVRRRRCWRGPGVDPATIALVSLSTTLATNALVEGQGGRVGLVLIGFDKAAASRAGIVDALRGDPCIRIDGGHDAAGRACAELDLVALDRAISGLEASVAAFAVAGMFSVRNPEHEIAVRDRLRERTGLPVTCGHELSSRLDGPRRAMTCVLNARLVPTIQRLLDAAERSFGALGVSAPMMVVRGDGALVGAEVARLKPVETILSGPAASLVGASHLTGERDALVSDIGGTTTDYALLVDGRPRIDPDGASVGGFRTMVEAVAMRTVGLGGDSEVRWGTAGRGADTGQRLLIGPRRLVPLSLLATGHPELVADTLERQRAAPRRGGDIGRFALRVDAADRVVGDASRRESMLLDRLAAGPAPFDRLLESQAETGALESLVGRGLVIVSGATPSDAAHVLGVHDEWDAAAALAGISLFAEQLDSRGVAIAPDAETMSRAIVDALVESLGRGVARRRLRPRRAFVRRPRPVPAAGRIDLGRAFARGLLGPARPARHRARRPGAGLVSGGCRAARHPRGGAGARRGRQCGGRRRGRDTGSGRRDDRQARRRTVPRVRRGRTSGFSRSGDRHRAGEARAGSASAQGCGRCRRR